MVFEVGYTGSQGRKLLFGTGQQANQLDPKYFSMGAALDAAGDQSVLRRHPDAACSPAAPCRSSACCGRIRSSPR